MKDWIVTIVTISIIAIAAVISYAITALFTYLICYGFDIEFSFKYALGVWLILILLKYTFKLGKKS